LNRARQEKVRDAALGVSPPTTFHVDGDKKIEHVKRKKKRTGEWGGQIGNGGETTKGKGLTEIRLGKKRKRGFATEERGRGKIGDGAV